MRPTQAPARAAAATPVRGGDAPAHARVAALLTGVVAPGVTVLLAGSDPAAEVRAALAEGARSRIVVVVSGAPTPGALRRLLTAGAAGIVPAAELDTALAPTCHAVAAGQLAVPLGMVRQVARPSLSHREKQVLGLVVEGCTNREIATRLFVAESTVKTHLASVYDKLGAHSRADVAARVLDPDSGYEPSMLLAPVTGAQA
ncbi:helix-turn-helix transcriptional regulator [Conexibacter woesei]|uniref:helix-turn-helix transcriptional regulator n=1 Tax=Conexibacter woesei TaxID=191495 RepID=UPI000686B5BA|nr:response regulator transcription factor [Conexibacter woesei]